MDKGSISKLLMAQAKESLDSSIIARNIMDITREVQLSINIHLLLGITLEGIINEIGESVLDSWTWNELEKVTTPLKWKMVSGLKKGFEPSVEPLQTIIKVQKIRNKIAHPKLESQGSEIIAVSDNGEMKILINGEDKLPEGNLTLYLGYIKLIPEYNARISLTHMIKVLEAINKIKILHNFEKHFEWSDDLLKDMKKIEIKKNKFDE